MLIGGKMKYFLIGIIKIYQMTPTNLHAMCRHIPSCSEYAILALQKYGCIKGSILAIKRILRCRKGGTFGYDPIP